VAESGWKFSFQLRGGLCDFARTLLIVQAEHTDYQRGSRGFIAEISGVPNRRTNSLRNQKCPASGAGKARLPRWRGRTRKLWLSLLGEGLPYSLATVHNGEVVIMRAHRDKPILRRPIEASCRTFCCQALKIPAGADRVGLPARPRHRVSGAGVVASNVNPITWQSTDQVDTTSHRQRVGGTRCRPNWARPRRGRTRGGRQLPAPPIVTTMANVSASEAPITRCAECLAGEGCG